MLELKVKGTDKVLAALTRFPHRSDEAIESAIEYALPTIEGFIKEFELSGQLLNVRTGNLRASIGVRKIVKEGLKIYGQVKAGGWGKDRQVFYAKYLEEGTKYIKPRWYMKKGLAAKKDEVIEKINEKILEICKGWAL